MNRVSKKDYHAFEIKGRCFVLDVERSFLYSIRPEVFQVITEKEGSLHDMHNLPFYERWILKNELRNIKRKIKPLSEEKREAELSRLEKVGDGMYGIWLGVSHVCNLGCSYCFANEPAYLGTNRMMTAKTAKKGIDYLIENSINKKDLKVIFFGGEPLLNLPVIKETVAYCHERSKDTEIRFTFSMTTNGTLLTRDVFETLRELRIATMVSIDGLPEIQNEFRKTKAGEPSWDIIADNLAGIPNFGDYIPARATVVEDDMDLVASVKALRNIGFKKISFGQLCSNSGMNTKEEDFRIEVWKKRYDELLDYCIEVNQDNNLENFPISNLQFLARQIYLGARRHFCCATGRYFYYIDPDEGISPCFRLLTKDSDQKIGTLDDTTHIEEKTRVFFETNVYRTKCRNCWARYICGGPCFGDSFYLYGDYETPDPVTCEKNKYLIYSAAYLLDHYSRKKSDEPKSA